MVGPLDAQVGGPTVSGHEKTDSGQLHAGRTGKDGPGCAKLESGSRAVTLRM